MFQKLFFISLLSSFIFTHSYSQCLDHQKSLLLQLKNELIFNSSLSTKLVQWNQTYECCKWHGVECDGTGHVISLQLDFESISGGIGDLSSLFRLKHLEKLNLAYNDITDSKIPKGIGNLTHLTHLNLSHVGFSGQVPLQLSLLTRLVSLDISTPDYVFYDDYWHTEHLKLEHPNLDMLLQNLTGLRELYLDKVNITSSRERTKWSHIISSYLPNITTLSLRFCYLSGPLAKSFWQLHSLSILRLDGNDLSRVNQDLFANFSSLTTLSLVGCNLKGPFPNKIFDIPTLQHLDLSYNEELSGSMPPFPRNGTLKSIRLSWTNFSSLTTLRLVGCNLKGPFPNKIFQIPTLQHLDLSDNEELSGSLPPFPQNGSLQSINLGRTNFSGSIPTSIGNLKTLSKIDLSNCKFRGPIPSTFANLTELTYVDLSYNFFESSLSSTMFEGFSSLVNLDLGINSFSGNIPYSLFSLPSLQTLYLHYNKFIGPIEEFPTGNVSKIVCLDLSSNRLEGLIPDSFFQLQSLEALYLDGNSFSGAFQLDKIQSLANLTELDLSDSSLTLHVSNSNSYRLAKLTYLILRSCNLYDFPHFIKHSDRMYMLDLSNNQISGEIPNWIWGTQLWCLNLSFNLLTHVQKPYHIPPSLAYLDLQSNQLREELHPPFPPNTVPDLYYLSLGNNSLSGSIPTSLCRATQLIALDLSMNKLSGTIPSCLFDGPIGLQVLDLGRNNISGHIPDSFTPSCMMTYFDVNNNTIQGKIPKSIKRCKWLEVMNVGNNIISDTFPCMLSSTLRVLVLHSNRFHGEVKCYNSSSWKELQIIDISLNNFSGSLRSVNFSTWRAMVVGLDGQFGNYHELRYNTSLVPKVGVIRLTMKGLEVELVKIYPDFTAIDFSCNNFRGEMPNAIGDLISLHLLNFSHNALNGSIPKSFGKLGQLESLDLSRNQLRGHIPTELSRLTFLSVLNLSYNELVGEIPKGKQLQTFSADSFIGNPGLCGFNLNISCTSHTDDDESDEKDEEKKKREIEWEYVSAALGYAVGLGSFVWFLLFCRSFRHKYFGKIDEIVEDILDARERRRRRRSHARRVERNRVVRRH